MFCFVLFCFIEMMFCIALSGFKLLGLRNSPALLFKQTNNNNNKKTKLGLQVPISMPSLTNLMLKFRSGKFFFTIPFP
jgi:membrane glycosyltransferase